jgi:hypothetical protein
MSPAALSLLWTLLALMPTPHLRESLKALLTGHGKARPQQGKTKSPSALPHFLNRYPWPTRALIRLVLRELHALGQGPPGGGARSACLCRICGRCKF